ncbi:MAG: hypothetical protein DHS20C17_18900 [Cyclobacteriaceae bacterium]|nr:MAG: hypothetical protein DHS20C17_18900 [Cyclobacteriaceae bacterium]
MLGFLLVVPGLLPAQSAFDKMSKVKLEKILHREATEVDRMPGTEEIPGRWKIIFMQRELFVIADEPANRMRIMTPIIEEENLDNSDLKLLLQANFDRALDAKYSLYQGVLWSSFTHPLQELTVEQLKDALKQVATLADRYGDTYSSTDLVFGAGSDEK